MIHYGLYIMTIVAGATMAHSLVPPTPGPLFVAEQLNVNLGLMIVMGLAVGSVTCASGYVYSTWVNRKIKWHVPLRDSPDSPLAKLEEISHHKDKSLPHFGLALLPVGLPILLIAGNTILQKIITFPSASWSNFLNLVGDKNIALIISAIVSLGLLIFQKREDKQQKHKDIIAEIQLTKEAEIARLRSEADVEMERIRLEKEKEKEKRPQNKLKINEEMEELIKKLKQQLEAAVSEVNKTAAIQEEVEIEVYENANPAKDDLGLLLALGST